MSRDDSRGADNHLANHSPKRIGATAHDATSRPPQQRRSTGVTGSTTACSSGNPSRCRRGGAIAEFTMKDQGLKVARDLKGGFPMLQVKVYDAENKRSEATELATA